MIVLLSEKILSTQIDAFRGVERINCLEFGQRCLFFVHDESFTKGAYRGNGMQHLNLMKIFYEALFLLAVGTFYALFHFRQNIPSEISFDKIAVRAN